MGNWKVADFVNHRYMYVGVATVSDHKIEQFIEYWMLSL